MLRGCIILVRGKPKIIALLRALRSGRGDFKSANLVDCVRPGKEYHGIWKYICVFINQDFRGGLTLQFGCRIILVFGGHFTITFGLISDICLHQLVIWFAPILNNSRHRYVPEYLRPYIPPSAS